MRRVLVATCVSLTIIVAGCEGQCVAGCDNKINDKETIAKIDAEQAAEKVREEEHNRRVISVCHASVQKWLDRWGNGDKVLDWRSFPGGASTGYVISTATGYRYSIGASVSGHSAVLANECFTDKSYNLLDLQAKWIS